MDMKEIQNNMEQNQSGDYEVIKIIGHVQFEDVNYYKVLWAPSWEPEENLTHAQGAIQQYKKSQNQVQSLQAQELGLKKEEERKEQKPLKNQQKKLKTKEDITIQTDSEEEVEVTEPLRKKLKHVQAKQPNLVISCRKARKTVYE